MKNAFARTLAGFALLALTITPALCRATDSLAVAPAAAARFVEIAATPATLDQLRDGGFALYLRHGTTDNARPMDAGSNRLLIAHAPNLMDLIGYFPKEATLVVFRPLSDAGFEYLASIPPALWPEPLHQEQP